MITIWVLFGHIQPSSFHGSFYIFSMLFNHKGPCTIQCLLPTVLPFQRPGTQERCLNGSSVVCTKTMPTSLCAVVKLLCTKSGEHAPYTCLEGCVFGQLLALWGALEKSRILHIDCSLQDAYPIHVGVWLIFFFFFLLFERVYVTADF